MAKAKETRIVAAALHGVDAGRHGRHAMSDTALGHTIRFNPMEVALPTGSTPGRFLSRGYVDRLVHTAHG
ncbi:hypothetical protein BCEN4_700006 [Burkholderia cenocepacia]|uniref:hypothetical protein n=1 Tax=Burkholderia cenocepacia TaxID=95486 RepID=UPI00192BEB58|nr:hypothetical protein [Burkholderia cenocepacia]CAD9227644.1 hypothetical protein BCEN4_700006 [Burkholderia cenocepacia]